MNKTVLVSGIVGLVVVIGFVLLVMHSSSTPVAATAAVSDAQPVTTASPVAVAPSANAAPFAQYKYASKAHEIFPTLAADTKKALGAFSYTKTDLGNGTFRFTLTNSAEGYKGQSVVVGAGQTLYFIEPSFGDDSVSEDSITTDDFFVAVDAQGNILK